MPFELSTFCRTRPRLYHLTASSNIPRILAQRALAPAASLLRSAGRPDVIRNRRPASIDVLIGPDRVNIRDQSPLFEGNVRLEGGWTFEDVVADLNARVYFWPGSPERPIPSGQNHFRRYVNEDCQVIVIDTVEMFAANSTIAPQFGRFNSGSPRCNPARDGDKRSPRGPSTFLPCNRFVDRPSDVVEVTFTATVAIPPNAMVVSPASLLNRA